MEAVLQALQAVGVEPNTKSRGYVVAVFLAHNQAQSTLLDYTRVGEVVPYHGSVPFRDDDEHLDTPDVGEEKSSLNSLNDVVSDYLSILN